MNNLKMSHEEILVTQSFMPPLEEFVNEIKGIWQTRWLTNMGEKHQEFERRLQTYLQVPHISLMVNGHMALEMVLQGLALSGEVVTTPFTFASTTHAIVRNGLTPVFCDINDRDFTIDANQIESLITEKTSAIVPVHVYGNICDVDKISRIAEKYNLKVIYDAAHTFGMRYKGHGAASFGDASILSFHATKVFHSIEGGAVCFRDEELVSKLYYLKNFGIQGPEQIEAVGANAKMNEFQAAMGLCNLRYLDDVIAQRKHIAQRYQERLKDIRGLRIWKAQDGVEPNYAYFPIVIEPGLFGATRDDVFDAMEKENIHARKYFFPATNEFACYKGKFEIRKTPVAARISRQILCLPIYGDLDPAVVDEICDIIVACRRT